MIAYILNLLDLTFTYHAIHNGGIELNPLMQSMPIMMIYKIIVVGGLCWWLSRQHSSLAIWGLSGLTGVYAMINVWHIFNICLR